MKQRGETSRKVGSLLPASAAPVHRAGLGGVVLCTQSPLRKTSSAAASETDTEHDQSAPVSPQREGRLGFRPLAGYTRPCPEKAGVCCSKGVTRRDTHGVLMGRGWGQDRPGRGRTTAELRLQGTWLLCSHVCCPCSSRRVFAQSGTWDVC